MREERDAAEERYRETIEVWEHEREQKEIRISRLEHQLKREREERKRGEENADKRSEEFKEKEKKWLEKEKQHEELRENWRKKMVQKNKDTEDERKEPGGNQKEKDLLKRIEEGERKTEALNYEMTLRKTEMQHVHTKLQKFMAPAVVYAVCKQDLPRLPPGDGAGRWALSGQMRGPDVAKFNELLGNSWCSLSVAAEYAAAGIQLALAEGSTAFKGGRGKYSVTLTIERKKEKTVKLPEEVFFGDIKPGNPGCGEAIQCEFEFEDKWKEIEDESESSSDSSDDTDTDDSQPE
jgi:hypothetical protein